MPSLHKRLRSKIKVPTIYGASDQKVTRFFIFNRAWVANERIVGLTALLVVGLGFIGYATFALSLNAPAGNIDSPAANGTVFGPNAAITGWAVAASPISHVDIVVNGVPARASYGTGGPRQDVCNLYPQSPNCAGSAQVGWQYYFNSTAMPNGTYSLYANIYGSSGGFTSTPIQYFTVQNTAPFGYIDTPAPGQTVGNNATPGSTFTNVGGWALDNETGISQVVMSIDGIATVYYPIYGANRPDVCAAYPGRPNCPNPGFNYNLDTANIPNGTHTMHITMYDSDGIQRSATMDRTFTISNNTPPPVLGGPGTGTGGGGGGGGATPPPSGTTVGGNGFLDGSIDDPKPANQSPPNPYTGGVTFDGWALGVKTVVNSVKLYIDGNYIGAQAQYGQGGARTDVCANHAGWINCVPATGQGCCNVGWQVYYDTSKLTNGTHSVKAVIGDGSFPAHDYSTPTVSFTTKNTVLSPPSPVTLPPVNPPSTGTNLPPDVYIDAINDPGTSDTTVSGWALDNITKAESAISSVVVRIINPNGTLTLVGSATYGGAGNAQNYRPDVCSKYLNRPGCPYVGWNMLFDTSYLPIGTYNLQVTATDATGQSRSAVKSFIVKNDGCTPGAQACAAADSTGRTKNDRNANNVKQFHVIYVVPSDLINGQLKYDRRLDTNGSLGASVNAINNYMKGQKYGKAFKVDTYAGKIDTTFVRVANKAAFFKQFPESPSSTTPDQFINALVDDIQKANPKLFVSNKHYVIYFEGASKDGCADTSGRFSVINLMGSQGSATCDSMLGFSAGSSKATMTQLITAHEMLHSLGAVANLNGKNTCVNHPTVAGLGHVTDTMDLMRGPAPIQFGAKLDINNDSYWGPNVDTSGCFRVDTDPSSMPYLL